MKGRIIPTLICLLWLGEGGLAQNAGPAAMGRSAMGASGIGASAAGRRPNIIFILSDDHAYQAISAYGDPLGEAFQLRDDVLGVFGESERTEDVKA